MTADHSRRKFLKNTALTGLATGLTPAVFAADEQSHKAFPVPEKENGLVFLFQGDSITDGNRGRNKDPNHVMGHGYAFAVASRIGADFPWAGFTFYNRGISGNKVWELEKRWQEDTLDLKPDVLSILIGINDAADFVRKPAEAPGVEEFELVYRHILTQCKEANPGILFVLGIPFVYPVGQRKDNWESWRDETSKRAEITKKMAAGFGAILVDYPAVFDKAMKDTPMDYWIWDGVHPTIFGHELMAREWINQVSRRLKFLRKYSY
jgi:lysophospholipase L1-like esterase